MENNWSYLPPPPLSPLQAVDLDSAVVSSWTTWRAAACLDPSLSLHLLWMSGVWTGSSLLPLSLATWWASSSARQPRVASRVPLWEPRHGIETTLRKRRSASWRKMMMMMKTQGGTERRSGYLCFHRRRCSRVCGPWKSVRRRGGRRVSYANED